MLKVGLTGGIGSGKSTVAKIFNVLGIPVFDADSEAKKLMETPPIRTAIQLTFGAATYTNNHLNRKVLSDIVFSDAVKLAALNAIVHPATITAARQWMERQMAAFVIKEAALLFEAGTTSGLNYIIGVTAPKAMRIERVMQRDNSSQQMVESRMDKQMDESLKMKLCDFVLHNNGQQLLTTQVLNVYHQLLALEKGSG